MTRRAISVAFYVGQCWKITAHHLAIVRMTKARGALSMEYDVYARAVISFFRRTEEQIKKTNKFNKMAFDDEIKKVIEGVRNTYNDKKILWACSTSSVVKKKHLK